jgi:hypothetical protein
VAYIRNHLERNSEIQDHLNATITERALSALVPNVFSKNKAATMTPEFLISSFVAAL